MLPLLTILASLSLFDAAPIARPRWCSPPAMATTTITALRKVLDGGAVERERMYSLPPLPSDSVVRVTDERVCERAARTYYRHELGPIPAGGVVVVRVGNRYAVYGDLRAGEWTILSIYSDQFELISNIAM